MKDLHDKHDEPVPEGLEFNENYMADAFAMYDTAKEKRKRRILIWWLWSSTGFAAAVLSTGMLWYFGTAHKNTPNRKHAYPTRVAKLPIEIQLPDPQTSPISARLEKTGRSEEVNTNTLYRQRTDEPYDKAIEPQVSLQLPEISQIPESSATSDLHSDSDTGAQSLQSTAQSVDSTVTVLSENNNDSIVAQTPQSQTDSTHRTPQPADSIPVAAAGSKHHFYAETGISALFGMQELKGSFKFKECLGISYDYHLNERVLIGAAAQYHAIPRITYVRTIDDPASLENGSTVLMKTTLNYIGLAPFVSWQLTPRHRISTGIGFDYLLTDIGQKYELSNYTSVRPKGADAKLYYSTFNRLNFSAVIGYRYQLSDYLALRAEYRFGLTDITRNNSENSIMDRNSRLQLSLLLKIR